MIQYKIHNDISKTQWSRPMGIKELSQIFEVHRNTMSSWLKKQIICNRKLSPRKWEVAVFELPCDLTTDNPEVSSQVAGAEYSYS
jgi:hypothetical protein